MVATTSKLLACAALVALVEAQLGDSGTVVQCDTKYDAVSEACCIAGSSSRRLQTADIADCPLPNTCDVACAKLLPIYIRKCGATMGLTGIDGRAVLELHGSFTGKCLTVKWPVVGGTGLASYEKIPKAGCGYNTTTRYRSVSAAEKACSALPTSACSGVYGANCASTSMSQSYYLCMPGYMPVSTYKTNKCVGVRPGYVPVSAPTDACLASPCKNGAKCTSRLTLDYTRGSATYRQYISKFTCNCAGTGFMNTRADATCNTKSPCIMNPCKNGATCTDSKYNSDGYTCRCPAYDPDSGTIIGNANCATEFTDPCASNPCQNGGTCKAYASTRTTTQALVTVSCRCTQGYTGQFCGFKLAPNSGRPTTCAGSTMQTCKRMCPPISCAAGQCVMHTDSCCGRSCQVDPNYDGDGSAANMPDCTAAETAAGKQPSNCGTQCPMICGKTPKQFCSMQCVLACQCPKGDYYDATKNKCVQVKQCTTPPPPPTGGGMIDPGFTMKG